MKIQNFKTFEEISAREFAKKAHEGQYRRGRDKDGNKIEYFIHPLSVASIVRELKKSHRIEELVSAAYLHDCVEDCNVSLDDIKEQFGELVASLVSELTSNEEQIKLVGKEEYLTKKLLSMSSWGLVIKLADRLHNVRDIYELYLYGSDKEKRWALGYAVQTNNLLESLEKNRELSNTQKRIVALIREKLDEFKF